MIVGEIDMLAVGIEMLWVLLSGSFSMERVGQDRFRWSKLAKWDSTQRVLQVGETRQQSLGEMIQLELAASNMDRASTFPKLHDPRGPPEPENQK